MERNNFISLGTVYATCNIPASMKNIITQEDIKPWSYLQSRVELNRVRQEGYIGILIGNNIPPGGGTHIGKGYGDVLRS